jgi:hypothetical protein
MYPYPALNATLDDTTSGVVNTLRTTTIVAAAATYAWRLVTCTVTVRSSATVGDRVIFRLSSGGNFWAGTLVVGYYPTHSFTIPDPGFQCPVNTALAFSTQASAVSMLVTCTIWYYSDTIS